MSGRISLEDAGRKSVEEVIRALETGHEGLSEHEAAQRLAAFGSNEFARKKKTAPLRMFLSKFRNPALAVLVAAAVISVFLGSLVDASIIIAMVFASTMIDFVNTFRSERAAERLRGQVRVTVAVKRGGAVKERNVHEIVPGDIICLAAGDLVPADSVFLEGKDVFVNESVLTGESVPVEKGNTAPGSRMLFTGTSVVSGRATAIVVATGGATRMGKIAAKLSDVDEPTEFDRNLKSFSFFMFRTTLFLVLAIVVVNLFLQKDSPLTIFLFAVAVAVGITPELLPMVITANLAKGAVKMSRHGVIVKQLSAIHNFGSIDVLCTDKTGTLTQDKITLIKYLDGLGKDSDEVLFWGYLESFHVSGVRGAMDTAIVAYRKLDISGWEKVDEIPFDFERRKDTIVVRKGEETRLISKGAPEEILKGCASYGVSKEPLSGGLLEQANGEYARLSGEGFRVLGLAMREMPKKGVYGKEDESGMSFLGFLAFLDPPKKTVRETLKRMIDHGVEVKIITGDNHLVTRKVAQEIELPIKSAITGQELAGLGKEELMQKVEGITLFTRVTPEQKEDIIKAIRSKGHVVGYLGDGANDLLSLKAADVGISVNNGVDVAKDAAHIILLHKGLDAVIEGIIEGRKTFANTVKYLMMVLSSNFGNMVSMPIASVYLPFLPMTASQILLNNFIYDASQLTIPFDNVDREFLKKPRKFNIAFIKKFMLVFGPVSSLFDFLTFGILFFVLKSDAAGFQTGWFLESIATQTLVVNFIRTPHLFTKSRPGILLLASSFVMVGVSWILPFTSFGALFGFGRLDAGTVALLAGIVGAYLFVVEGVKRFFFRRFGHLLEKE
jgi:Mg2+-importing ATPase